MTAVAKGHRLRVDWTRCDAHGICAELLPELVSLDDWGYPLVRDRGEVPRELRRHAEHAVVACPRIALHLQQVDDHR
jgi:ferredoxin